MASKDGLPKVTPTLLKVPIILPKGIGVTSTGLQTTQSNTGLSKATGLNHVDSVVAAGTQGVKPCMTSAADLFTSPNVISPNCSLFGYSNTTGSGFRNTGTAHTNLTSSIGTIPSLSFQNYGNGVVSHSNNIPTSAYEKLYSSIASSKGLSNDGKTKSNGDKNAKSKQDFSLFHKTSNISNGSSYSRPTHTPKLSPKPTEQLMPREELIKTSINNVPVSNKSQLYLPSSMGSNTKVSSEKNGNNSSLKTSSMETSSKKSSGSSNAFNIWGCNTTAATNGSYSYGNPSMTSISHSSSVNTNTFDLSSKNSSNKYKTKESSIDVPRSKTNENPELPSMNPILMNDPRLILPFSVPAVSSLPTTMAANVSALQSAFLAASGIATTEALRLACDSAQLTSLYQDTIAITSKGNGSDRPKTSQLSWNVPSDWEKQKHGLYSSASICSETQRKGTQDFLQSPSVRMGVGLNLSKSVHHNGSKYDEQLKDSSGNNESHFNKGPSEFLHSPSGGISMNLTNSALSNGEKPGEENKVVPAYECALNLTMNKVPAKETATSKGSVNIKSDSVKPLSVGKSAITNKINDKSVRRSPHLTSIDSICAELGNQLRTTKSIDESGIPIGIAVARQRQEPKGEDVAVPHSSASPSVPTSTTTPTLAAHWPLPPTPCTPSLSTSPFWLTQGQFSGIDSGVSTGLGLGYQFARDPLSGHLILIHPLADPSSHGLMWAGYSTPPMMIPQHLIMRDYHRALHPHPALLHMTPQAPPPILPSPPEVKCESTNTNSNIDEITKSLNQTPAPLPGIATAAPGHLPPHFLYPPVSASIPYYTATAAPYPLSPFPATPVPNVAATSTIISEAKDSSANGITEVTNSNVMSSNLMDSNTKHAGKNFEFSPVLKPKQVINISSASEVDNNVNKSKCMQDNDQSTKTTMTCSNISRTNTSKCSKPIPPLISLDIKQEIKQEVISPMCDNSLSMDIGAKKIISKMEQNISTVKTKVKQEKVSNGTDLPIKETQIKEKPNKQSQYPECLYCTGYQPCSLHLNNTESNTNIDISGLELLSQSVLQHANRIDNEIQCEESKSPRENSVSSIVSNSSIVSPSNRTEESNAIELNCLDRTTVPVSPDLYSVTENSTKLPDLPVGASVPNSSSLSPSNFSGLNLLCALAEQRIIEEQSVNGLSSLADVAATTPLISTESTDEIQSISDDSPRIHTTELGLPSSSIDDTSPNQPIDINRNYKSPESERDVKAYLASKSVPIQANEDDGYKTPPGLRVNLMDPVELKTRMEIAEIQRKYKEKQKKLSKLQTKKENANTKKSPGRPKKKKLESHKKVNHYQSSCDVYQQKSPNSCDVYQPQSPERSTGSSPDSKVDLFPPVLEPINEITWNPEDTDDTDDHPLNPPVLIPSFTQVSPVQSIRECSEDDQSSDDDNEDSTPTWMSSISLQTIKSSFKSSELPKSEESEEESIVKTAPIISNFKIVNNNVDSCASDNELPASNTSSSKKRKPGRPKKHSPTKEDATETIVAKKPKSISFLLMNHKPKMKPKLKAEVKVRECDVDDDDSSQSISLLSSPGHISFNSWDQNNDTNHDYNRYGSNEDLKHTSDTIRSHNDTVLVSRGARRRGTPRGRSSFTRKSMLRDKEKRKNVAERQAAMEPLYRSLKRHATMAAAGHDESDESEDDTECRSVREISNGDDDNARCGLDSYFGSSNHSMTTFSNLANGEQRNHSENDVCKLEAEDLTEEAPVLILRDGLLYAGKVTAIDPPSVYGVNVIGERSHRPLIYGREELLEQAWKDVKPGSTRFLAEGTRVCAFWSRQYRGLYPGTVAAACSPIHESSHNFVNVEFDDGDSGRIHVDDIRLLPPQFPIIDYDPNPLLTLNKRKRRLTDEATADKKNETAVESKKNKKNKEDTEKISSQTNTQSTTSPVEVDISEDDPALVKVPEVEETPQENGVSTESANSSPVEKKHKKHRRKHKHEKRRRHDHWDDDDSPSPRPQFCVEQGDNELRMRIKSPPPLNEDLKPLLQPSHEAKSHRSPSYEESRAPSTDVSVEGDEIMEIYHSPYEEQTDDVVPLKKSKNKNGTRPARRKRRHPSEKSKIAAFLPDQQLWEWSGKGYKRPGGKGKGKKEFFKEIVRGKEVIRVNDCAVFLSTGRPDRPYIGKIGQMWESWGGNMVVKVQWFYHPEETKGLGKKLAEPRGALFHSPHTDENDVQTISHKCEVAPLSEYRIRRAKLEKQFGPTYDNYELYYVAGFYDPANNHIKMEPGVS